MILFAKFISTILIELFYMAYSFFTIRVKLCCLKREDMCYFRQRQYKLMLAERKCDRDKEKKMFLGYGFLKLI